MDAWSHVADRGMRRPDGRNRPDRTTPPHPPAAEAAVINPSTTEVHHMLGLVARDWWVYAVRGIAAFVFGILALTAPGSTLAVLVLLFGTYALVDGIALLVALVRGDILARNHAWATGLMGVAGIVFGIATWLWPGITALTLLYLVAGWSITVGILQIVAAAEFRREIDGELWMALGGAISIAFGILLVAFPSSGLVSLVWLVGIWAITSGTSSLALSIRLLRINRQLYPAALAA
jgi:uncharacterized membrane protein HdeD (DUF308 family)